jgi:hypothetical protein
MFGSTSLLGSTFYELAVLTRKSRPQMVVENFEVQARCYCGFYAKIHCGINTKEISIIILKYNV